MPSSVSQHQHPGIDPARIVRDGRAAGAEGGDGTGKGDGKGLSFWDLLDVVNPLQHIPVVNRIYRAVTGDEIGTPAKLAGGALLFGPVGLAVAAADSLLERETGRDAFGHALAMFRGDDGDGAPPASIGVASSNPSSEVPAPQRQLADAADLWRAIELRQAAELAEGPGASAARAALGGLPPVAAVGTLPAPGAGLDGATLAALSDAHTKKEPTEGKGLDQYRRLAAGMPGATAPRTYVPQAAVQAALHDRDKPGAAAMIAAAGSPAMIAGSAGRAATAANPSNEIAAEKPRLEANERQNAESWPPGGPAPLPPALIADMMSMAMDKYEAQARNRGQQRRQQGTVNGQF